jgi:hypothetical protein
MSRKDWRETLRSWRRMAEQIQATGSASRCSGHFLAMQFCERIQFGRQLTERGRRFLAEGPCIINPQWPAGWDWVDLANDSEQRFANLGAKEIAAATRAGRPIEPPPAATPERKGGKIHMLVGNQLLCRIWSNPADPLIRTTVNPAVATCGFCRRKIRRKEHLAVNPIPPQKGS